MMPTDLEVFLADVKAKTDAATPGEWEHDVLRSQDEYTRSYDVHRILPDNLAIVGNTADAEFIAMSREAMPKLLAAVESVRALCESPYEVPFEDSPPGGGVLVSDIRKAITDALNGDEQ